MNNPSHPETPTEKLAPIAESTLERIGSYWETTRLWLTQAWRIAFLMARGAYLTQERRNLFGKLGEEVFYKIQKGELRNTELQNQVKEIERLTKKLEISEIKIRSLRFGQRISGANNSPLEEKPGEPS
ncbi:MAG: hypothetical protein EBQ92_08695 [Proteobacteria bacterium]|nr:hypothetical protein [Pseudomonadota bacterium]